MLHWQSMKPCSNCGRERDRPGQRYCRSCHNAYQRQWRKERGGYSGLTEAERYKERARALARNYRKRGKLTLEGKCYMCRARNHLEMHHSDYSKPLNVVELCRRCHRRLHKTLKEYANG